MRKKERLERLFKQSNIGERFKNSTFDKISVLPEHGNLIDRLKDYATSFSPKSKSILMYSHPGTGKTTLAGAVANQLLSNGISAIFCPVPDLMMKIISSFKDPRVSEESIIHGLASCDLLILDDLGAEYHKNKEDWSTGKLYQIINSRYTNNRATIFTTNCSLPELCNKLGIRTFSRICEMSEGWKLDLNHLKDWRMSNYV